MIRSSLKHRAIVLIFIADAERQVGSQGAVAGSAVGGVLAVLVVLAGVGAAGYYWHK